MELAQEIVKSELLVSEDEDFINNFILSEDTLEEYKKAGESGGSVLGDVLLFSGSLAAVAGSIQLINSPSLRGICIENWSQNFDQNFASAIFGTPQVLKIKTLF